MKQLMNELVLDIIVGCGECLESITDRVTLSEQILVDDQLYHNVKNTKKERASWKQKNELLVAKNKAEEHNCQQRCRDLEVDILKKGKDLRVLRENTLSASKKQRILKDTMRRSAQEFGSFLRNVEMQKF